MREEARAAGANWGWVWRKTDGTKPEGQRGVLEVTVMGEAVSGELTF